MLNREVQEFEKRYIFWGSYISILEGKILTQLEASIIDGKQLEALKSVFREMIWKWAEETSYCDNCRNGNGKRNLPIKNQQHFCEHCNCYYDQDGTTAGAKVTGLKVELRKK